MLRASLLLLVKCNFSPQYIPSSQDRCSQGLVFLLGSLKGWAQCRKWELVGRWTPRDVLWTTLQYWVHCGFYFMPFCCCFLVLFFFLKLSYLIWKRCRVERDREIGSYSWWEGGCSVFFKKMKKKTHKKTPPTTWTPPVLHISLPSYWVVNASLLWHSVPYSL